MEDGFVKGYSTNLPRVSSLMVAKFFATNPDFCPAELRNVKTSISGRESYGDDAIGYVQLKRETNHICTIKCTFCPEHKVRSKPYTAKLIVDEQEEVVKSVQCHDCPASAGGCKHGVAFLMWLHRRSEEPSCTLVECYWRKSNLAKVGVSIKILSAKDMAKRKPKEFVPENALVHNFIKECKNRKIRSCQFLKHELDFEDDKSIMSLHNLINKYCEENCDTFLLKILPVFNEENLRNTERITRDQYKTALWHQLRYGRITASRCYEVSRCKTIDGTLVVLILGAKTPDTTAITRGRKLEDKVRRAVQKKLGIKIKTCGLYISKTTLHIQNPMFAASPDGIYEKTTFEIKCPTSDRTMKNYIDQDGKITKKYFAQVQMQMYCSDTCESYFCVASCNFESDNQVALIKVSYDNQYVITLLDSVVSFWKNIIFPILYKSVTL